MIKGNRFFQWLGRAMFMRNLNRHITNPELRAKLTPDYPIGAKRILVSDTLFPALTRANVELTNSGVAKVLPIGIQDNTGSERSHDVIIYGTGFKTNPFLLNIEVVGVQDRKLCETWAKGARAYMGISVAGFPNLHLLYGPNTNTGHSSIIFRLEAQIGYIAQLIQRAGDGAIDIRQETADEFDAEMQRRLSTTAWNEVDGSWYKYGDRITNNWPGSSWEYYRRTKKPIKERFRVMRALTAE